MNKKELCMKYAIGPSNLECEFFINYFHLRYTEGVKIGLGLCWERHYLAAEIEFRILDIKTKHCE